MHPAPVRAINYIRIYELFRQITSSDTVSRTTGIVAVRILVLEVNPQRMTVIDFGRVLAAIKYNPRIKTGFPASMHFDDIILHVLAV